MPVEPIPQPPIVPPVRKGGVVVPNTAKWHQRLVAFLVWLLISAVAKTIRFQIHDPHGFLSRRNTGPLVFCFWHNRLALCVEMYDRLRRGQYASPDVAGVAGLVSASKDGALLSAIFERFGVQAVRGSSSRRGAQALRELTTWSERGYDLAITPDGPRGPRYSLADGTAGLACFTGRPIVPVSHFLHWKISLNSWDAFQIPLPFSICEVSIGRVFKVPHEANASDVNRETFRRELETELRSITRD
jgi:lysophospholipid acyltransferase (LPLAT)-like uncharacterized protein